MQTKALDRSFRLQQFSALGDHSITRCGIIRSMPKTLPHEPRLSETPSGMLLTKRPAERRRLKELECWLYYREKIERF